MSDDLGNARRLADKLRFSGEIIKGSHLVDFQNTNTVRNIIYQNGLKISKKVAPTLSKSLNQVYKRLKIPKKAVDAFVYASPEIQAECFTGSTSECIIRFSSSLIDIMTTNEFEFIVGHELGHFLLGHSGIINKDVNQESLEYFMLQRSREISSDRIGLLACKSLDVAVKALMKIVSGLNNQYLKLDVGEFISQLKKNIAS